MEKQERNSISRSIAQKFMNLDGLLHIYFRKNRKGLLNFGNRFEGQGQILYILERQPIISQKELNRMVKMRPQSTSEMIKKLEDKGYVRRYPSETDRRVLMIELTEAGKVFTENTFDNDFKPIALEVLTDEELNQFSAILDKLNGEMIEKLELSPDDLKRFSPGRRRPF